MPFLPSPLSQLLTPKAASVTPAQPFAAQSATAHPSAAPEPVALQQPGGGAGAAAAWRAWQETPSRLALAGLTAVALAVALVAAPLRTLAQAPQGAAGAAAAKPAMTVTVQAPTTVGWPVALAAHGSVAAWQEASVGAEANGLRLTEVRAQVGDRVRAGQVLAVFDAQAVQAEVQAARAAVAEATATAAEAQANAERARSLQGSGALSDQQLAQLATAAVTAQARVASAQAQLALQELRLRHATVLAPDAGVISARTATVGAVVPAGSELFRLIRQGRLEWRAEVPAAEMARVQPGQAVTVQVPGGGAVQGRVRTVAPTVDPQSRVGLIYADLQGSGAAALKAGMFARGELRLGEQPALTVPLQAVVNRDGFAYLFTLAAPVDAQGTARVTRLKVQTGRRMGDRVELLAGLPTGRPPEVVVQGAGFLNDGDTVKVVATPTEAKK
jgi:HlyD family secretion protein